MGKDMDERQGIETGRGAGPGAARRVKAQRGGADARYQLSPDQADLEALQSGRDKSIEARQRGPGIEPCQARGSSQASAATGARTLLRRAARALRADAGGRAFVGGPRPASIGADLAGAGCWPPVCGAAGASARRIASGGSAKRTSASGSRSTARTTGGSKNAGRKLA